MSLGYNNNVLPTGKFTPVQGQQSASMSNSPDRRNSRMLGGGL